MLASGIAGSMRVLRPKFVCLSPAVGAAAVEGSLTHNVAAHPHTVSESLLARELFLEAGGKLRATATQSKPGTHLDAAAWGSVIGLAMASAGQDEVRKVLEGCHSLAMRRPNQSNPPPSLSRYFKVVQCAADALHNGRGVGRAVLMHFMWEKAQSKQDSLDFLLALHAAAPQPVLDPEFVNDVGRQDAWLHLAFSKEDITCESSLEAAALGLLEEGGCDSAWAQNYELVTAGLSTIHAFRTPLRLYRFSYAQGREVADCVEVAMREVMELLLYQPHRRVYDVSLLPPTANPRIIRFFQDLNVRLQDSSAVFEAGMLQSAHDWFTLCQNLPGATPASSVADDGLEYVSTAPGGELYELKPSMQTMARALHHFLLGEGFEKPWDSLRDLAAFWNGHTQAATLTVAEERQIRRGLMSEDSVTLQRASLWHDSFGSGVHVELDAAHNMATCRHYRKTPSWASEGSVVHRAHLERALDGSRTRSVREEALALLWPAFLGGARLEAVVSGRFEPSPRQAVEAILSASYQQQMVDMSGFFVAGQTEKEKALARDVLRARVLRCVRLATTLAARIPDNEEEQIAVEMAQDSLAWLTRTASDGLATRELAMALTDVTPEMLQANSSLVTAMGERSQDGLMLSRMVEYAAHSAPLVHSLKGLGVWQAMDMMRFAWACRPNRVARAA